MARRFGSAMIWKTDSIGLIYPIEHIRVKAYYGRRAQAAVSIGVRNAPSDAFLGCYSESCVSGPPQC